MPPVVSRNLALVKIEDIIKLLNKEAKPLFLQEYHDTSTVALHKMSNIYAPASASATTTKKKSTVTTSKYPSVPDKSAPNLAHAHQLPRVCTPSKTQMHQLFLPVPIDTLLDQSTHP